MNCSRCGAENVKEAKFCAKCGTSLIGEAKEKSELAGKVKDGAVKTKNICLENLILILNFFKNPSKTLKNEVNGFNEFKKSGVLALIVSVIATLVSLIRTMLNVVIVKEYDWEVGTVTVWKWENLKHIDYIGTIFESLLYMLVVIAVIAGIYYIAGLIIKKDVKYPKLVGIVTLSITPLLVATLVVSPILTFISIELGLLATVVGLFYTMILGYESINDEFKLEGNTKYIFNLVCYTVLVVIAYIVVSKLLVATITSGSNGILNLIK